MKLKLTIAFCLACLSLQAANVADNIQTALGQGFSGTNRVRFTPVQPWLLSSNASPVIGYPVGANTDTNGNFGATNIIGPAFYNVDVVNSGILPFRVLIPGDNNTYNLWQVAQLAQQAALFQYITNFTTGTNGVNVAPGALVTASTNPAGPLVTISAMSQTNTVVQTNDTRAVTLYNQVNGTNSNVTMQNPTNTGAIYGAKYSGGSWPMYISQNLANGIRLDDGVGDVLNLGTNTLVLTDIANDGLFTHGLNGTNGSVQIDDGIGDIFMLQSGKASLSSLAQFSGNGGLLTNVPSATNLLGTLTQANIPASLTYTGAFVGNLASGTNMNLSSAQYGTLPVQGIFGNFNMDKPANVLGQLMILGKLRVLTIGDSTGDYIINGTAPFWEGQVGISGFITEGSILPYTTFSVINPSSAASINGGAFNSTNWWSVHYALSNTASLLYSGTANMTPSVSGTRNTNIYSDTLCVMWINRPGAGSFKIQTSTNGSAFGTINTISTANATASLQITNLFLGKGQYSFQVTGTGGGDGYAEFIMAGMYLTNSPGLFHLSMSGSGVDYTGYTSSSSNFQAKVMQFANPDVVILESRHPGAYPFYLMNQVSNVLGGNVPIVLVGQYAATPAGDIPSMLSLSSNNWWMAITNNYSFCDMWTPMHDTNKMNLVGFYVGSPTPANGEVHLNQSGQNFQGQIFMRALGFANSDMDSAFVDYASQNGVRNGIINGFSASHLGIGTANPLGHFDLPVSYGGTINHLVFDTAKDSFWSGLFFTPDSSVPGGKVQASPDTTVASAFLNSTNAVLLMFPNGVCLNAPQGGQIAFGRLNYDISSQQAGEVGLFDSTHDFNVGGYLWRFFASSGQSNSRKTGAGWANIETGLTVGASTSTTNVNLEVDNTGQFWVFNNATTNLLQLIAGNMTLRSNFTSTASIAATNGFSSLSASTATVNPTGYTNNMAINGQVVDVEVIIAGGTSVTVKDGGSTTRHTYATGPTNSSVILKPNWSVNGTAMTGDVISQ